jgi:hypothetical protein
VQSAKVAYGSAQPANAVHHASLSIVKVGQNVKLLVYATYTGVVGEVPIHLGFRVERSGRTVYFTSRSGTVSSSMSNGGTAAYWVYFRPKQAGAYTFSGTVFVGHEHQHKTVPFRVVSS